MTEIDQLNRISLADLRGFFENSKKLRTYVSQAMEEQPFVTAEEWADRKETYLLQNREAFRGGITFADGLAFSVEALIDTWSLEIYGFIFKWKTYEGEERSVKVEVSSRPSNLGLPEPVYYLVCPHTRRICRKLYTDGDELASRYAFPHTYSSRNESHDKRLLSRLCNLMREDEESHRYRKPYYRGKLTPFGERMQQNKLFRLLNRGKFSRLWNRRGQDSAPGQAVALQ